ncbi:MAG: tRNA (adenosine(37)-N6)-dimethylallyltransferase MiaA [Tenacibaculum sp.]
MTPTVIAIVGVTAIGKTTLSIELAKHFGSEILSFDSRQFYKELCIGTAVPNKSELAAVPHHFIQNISIFDNYNVGQFELDALVRLNILFKKKPVQIMVGGSGLYLDAVLKGLDSFPRVDPLIRAQLNAQFKSEGIEILQKQLALLDPVTYQSIDINNPQRLIRVLEICIETKKPYSSFIKKTKVTRNFNSIKIGLTAERNLIYKRINERVDKMIKRGLLSEAKKTHPYKHLNALQTVGYRELFSYFEGVCSLDFAVEEIKKNTRRFAKRQGTWFKKDSSVLWFDCKEDIKHIVNCIELKISQM